jgi:hypothetical protein
MSSQAERYQPTGSPFQTTDAAKDRAKIPCSLEDAIHAVVYEGQLPAKGIASAMGVRYGYLADAANPNREDTNFQARWVAPITKASGNDGLIHFLAHACGGVFVRLHQSGAFNEHTATILKETADVFQTAAAAEADGNITEREALQLRLQAEEAIGALVDFVAWMESRVREGQGSR